MSTIEEQRVIELYKYYVSDQLSDEDHVSQSEGAIETRPKPLNFQAQISGTGVDETNQISSPDTTLTALCQLAAIRLGVQRAGISLIARQTQYILAESTQTLNLRDTTKSDKSGDGLWMGLTECNRVGNLCENTIRLSPARDADVPPCFVVPDLRHDPRFSNAPYVAGVPNLKFYCGTPITTASNLNIGSFWVLDDRLLPEFTQEKKRFFGTMSSLVMRQLEMTREVSERQRAMKMGQALSSFVEGKLPVTPPQAQRQDWLLPFKPPFGEPPKATHISSEGQPPEPVTQALQGHGSKREPTQKSRLSLLREESSIDSQDTLSTGINSISSEESEPEESIDLTFARAAYLIREALDVQGCVFLDAASCHVTDFAGKSNMGLENRDSTSIDTLSARRERPTETVGSGAVTWSTTSTRVPAEVLAFAHETASSISGDSPAIGKEFTPIDAGLLQDLTKRYPNGTLWTFGEAGLITPTESFPPAQLSGRRPSASGVRTWRQQRESDAEALRQYFPRARQLVFAPLFDAALERSTAGCFAFNSRRSRVLTMESEVVFLKSFVNNVGAEISRMNTIAADRSKSDFIGSVSHELRSPLHGMLAAAEFLEETKLDSYQKSLIATQVSCGKTLLQVIEHVLDFSKINSLAKDEPAAGDQNDERMLGTKMQSLSVKTDIAELFEEVVEGSVAGKAHIVQNTAALNSRPSSMSTSTEVSAERLRHLALRNGASKDIYPGVAVLLNFDYQKDWTFTTQPGALRRILMNVLGNALKYTDSGYVKVRLAMAEPDAGENAENPSVMFLSIADTGKGISKSFLRTRLFRPFNQEDHLSTGCGLGLSIVKSLVTSLKGTLEIQSEQGVGTTVSVKLPLVRGRRNSVGRQSIQKQEFVQQQSLPPSVMSRTVASLRPTKRGPVTENRVAVSGLAVREEIRASVSKTMLDWLQMRPLDSSKGNGHADYVVFLADEISDIEDEPSMKTSKAIALLPHNFSRGRTEDLLAQKFAIYETIAAPFGPRKLARAIAACEATAASRQEGSMKNVESFALGDADANTAKTPLYASQDQETLQTMSQNADNAISAPSSGIQVGDGLTMGTNGADKKDEGVQTSEICMKSQLPRLSPTMNGVENAPLVATLEDTANSKAPNTRGSARLLLVDDNKINLSLLETFVKKQKRKLLYECAENGLLAVNAARQNSSGYDIIFMDVSMPVMDGLQATREIRKLETERVARMGEAAAPPPALVVALTGLANGRDRADAFASGVDLFMTKPTKFKEIGSLIEEWYEKGSQNIGARRDTLQDG